MAEIYCLCNKRNPERTERFRDRVNKFRQRVWSSVFPQSLNVAIVELNDPALCIKTGAEVVDASMNRLYPNVDIYRCLNCHNEFTVILG